MFRLTLIIAAAVGLFAAGCGVGPIPAHRTSAAQALTSAAELLEFESPAARQDLFLEVARLSQQQAGRTATGPVLFAIANEGEVISAPGLDARADLLQSPDAGAALSLVFDGKQRWAEDRRDSLQGLSEREAVELVARTLLSLWGVQPSGPVLVDRASGAPYAAAYVDGILRINPSFVYMAAASVSSFGSAAVQ